jgi:hypothetical protein
LEDHDRIFKEAVEWNKQCWHKSHASMTRELRVMLNIKYQEIQDNEPKNVLVEEKSNTMKSNKEYRFKDNPKEKEFHDKFIERFDSITGERTLSAIIFGWKNDRQEYPADHLADRDKQVCINLIQWLGSPVGQGFLRDCGFETKNK